MMFASIKSSTPPWYKYGITVQDNRQQQLGQISFSRQRYRAISYYYLNKSQVHCATIYLYLYICTKFGSKFAKPYHFSVHTAGVVVVQVAPIVIVACCHQICLDERKQINNNNAAGILYRSFLLESSSTISYCVYLCSNSRSRAGVCC